jgi:dephospho-CoA kinase
MAIHVFGLTGGIATGKSTVANHWRKRGLPVVNADELARQVVAPGTSGLGAVVNLFGAHVLTPRGTLDRVRVAKIVFSDPSGRASLESLLHPLIDDALKSETQELARRGEPLACYEAPLLVETGRADAFRPLVLVAATETTQVQRLHHRDGTSEQEIRSRIAAQLPFAQKAAKADFVILNDGTYPQLLAEADSTLAEVCRRLNLDELRYSMVASGMPNQPGLS